MIANLYAEALLKIAVRENNVEGMIEQFDRFVTQAKDNPDWIVLLDTASIRNKIKYQLLSELNIFDKNFLDFLMILIRNHHMRFYDEIYEQWIGLTRKDQKVAYINLYTAKRLSQIQLQKLKKEVQDFIPGMEIEFRIQIDPSLIRGIKMTYQGRSIERSLRRTLDDMKSNI